MIKDITLGQYYETQSVLHRLDPRTKLFGTLIFIISIFLTSSLTAFFAATLFFVSVIMLSRVPLRFMLRGLKGILIFIILTVLLNLFLTSGEPVFTIGVLQISMEGIESALLTLFRFIYLIVGTSVMTLTTTPNSLTDGLEKALRPLEFIKVPVHEIAMMMSIALRFIPIFVEETDKIIKAQTARGADFESGGIIRRAKAMIPILVPLFISAFRRANDLAMAMEARCYQGGKGRTKMKPLKYAAADFMAYFILIAYLAGVIAAGYIKLPLHVVM